MTRFLEVMTMMIKENKNVKTHLTIALLLITSGAGKHLLICAVHVQVHTESEKYSPGCSKPQ